MRTARGADFRFLCLFAGFFGEPICPLFAHPLLGLFLTFCWTLFRHCPRVYITVAAAQALEKSGPWQEFMSIIPYCVAVGGWSPWFGFLYMGKSDDGRCFLYRDGCGRRGLWLGIFVGMCGRRRLSWHFLYHLLYGWKFTVGRGRTSLLRTQKMCLAIRTQDDDGVNYLGARLIIHPCLHGHLGCSGLPRNGMGFWVPAGEA